ncbi:aromatic amino acid ammonia-lyase [bacterium]|nr:aromatic amino acid ammonia-lyase [bacterium]
MSIVLNGKNLSIETLNKVAKGEDKIRLDDEAIARIKACRAFLERKLAAGETMYGTNTGIGELSEVRLDDSQTKEFQKYLIFNHAAGIGDPMPIPWVRGAMLARINVHAQGYSACRPEITLTYVDMLNKGVTPVVCNKGSVGACGDLAPMAQIALSLMGEGESFYQGERMPTSKALDKAGIKVPGLEVRDGLASINGSNFISSAGCQIIYDAERWLKQADIAAAMSLEALLANMKPYESRLHELRGFRGAVASAENIRNVIAGSDLTTGAVKVKVQDAYSMRSSPQVIGAARDQLHWARQQFETELNGVNDNPIFLMDEDRVLTGANFQGSPISLPLDAVGTSIAMVCVLSERRLNRLLNSALSVGLPAFLTKGAGMFSGYMLSQYTACMLIVEQRILSAPASVLSIPAAADQEDFVSMGWNTALKTSQILENAYGVLGIEFIAAAQALDFRDFTPGRGTCAARSAVREVVEFLDVDRPLFPDHNNMMAAVKARKVLQKVEAEIGELRTY